MDQVATGPFDPPVRFETSDTHHERAAALNAAVAADASNELHDILSGVSPMERILLKAAAGAGKSYAIRRLVAESVAHPNCARVAITAFKNRQVWPLTVALGKALGKESVCLLASKDAWADVPDDAHEHATVVTTTSQIPTAAKVVLATVSRLSYERTRFRDHLGVGANGSAPFDVLFVDEAWEVAHHLFDQVTWLAPTWVGVGDVGQLPPLEVGENPWRGDPGYNPYRAWPTNYLADPRTWIRELPSVWRPAAGHLGLWRAFYPEWSSLDCVTAPGDRRIDLGTMGGPVAEIWRQVGTGVPTLLEIDGLPEPEAADVDLPLTHFVEELLDEFFASSPALLEAEYDEHVPGRAAGTWTEKRPGGDHPDPLVAILATRNQSVDDAEDAVGRLREKYDLTEHDLVASTVDKWQGQTNGITIAVHPLNGAAELDSFNSAFGRLAVACTRATHGLLMVARPGLDDLLGVAPARPGTPFGEPGNRQLPRQTHQRILATFARGRIDVSEDD